MARVRIEFAQIDKAHGGVDRPTALLGTSRVVTVSSTAVLSDAAPAFPADPGLKAVGCARVTALVGAVNIAWGDAPSASEGAGWRVEQGRTALAPLSPGQFVSLVEALDPPAAAPAWPAAGITTVSGSFTTATAAGALSGAFTPLAGRSFNVAVWGASVAPGASLAATIYLVRSTDSGATYLPLTAGGEQLYSFNSVASETVQEGQTSVAYALVCASVPSGTINYRISQ